jgi:UDP-N-acetylmuramyl pentapeptide phosphotransferase/UDP-N-acetylglucosamine-1-phosphate transferase
MTATRFLSLVLIVLGILGLVWGGITYTRNEKAVDLGPIEVNVEKKERVRIPPVLGGISLVAGVALATLGSRKN